jgi:hypothetical protein
MPFLPKEKKFFDLYEALAQKIVEAADLLGQLEKNYSQLPQIAENLEVLEDEADAIVHKIVNRLLYDHTRVTEEKGDIRFFAHNMDNIIDSIEKTANRLVLYKIENFPPVAAEFALLLKRAAQEIKIGVECIENLSKKEHILAEACIRINDLENEADKINRKWLQKIMAQSVETPDDVRKTIAIKEIIDLLEYAMDQCEDVANILDTFRLKGEA